MGIMNFGKGLNVRMCHWDIASFKCFSGARRHSSVTFDLSDIQNPS